MHPCRPPPQLTGTLSSPECHHLHAALDRAWTAATWICSIAGSARLCPDHEPGSVKSLLAELFSYCSAPAACCHERLQVTDDINLVPALPVASLTCISAVPLATNTTSCGCRLGAGPEGSGDPEETPKKEKKGKKEKKDKKEKKAKKARKKARAEARQGASSGDSSSGEEAARCESTCNHS